MTHIPESDLEALKRANPLAEVVRAGGIELKKHGVNKQACLCPFHREKTASCVVNTERNTFKCFGCGKGGDVIAWVRETRGCSFPEAVEWLRERAGMVAVAQSPPRKPPPGGTSLFSPDADATTARTAAAGYYRRRAAGNAEVEAFLARRGLAHGELIERFGLGWCDRTLPSVLAGADQATGAKQRERLREAGILRESGHEHLAGCVTIPIFNEKGEVTGMYGRKVKDHQKPGVPKHLYLPGPHVGVWNSGEWRVESGEWRKKDSENSSLVTCHSSLVLCESLIDALTFWVHGFRNVTACYGTNGFTEEILQFILSLKIVQVLLAFDGDDAGDRGARAIADKLAGHGIECRRVVFPRGADANEFALQSATPAEALGDLLKQAVPMNETGVQGSGFRVQGLEIPNPRPSTPDSAPPASARSSNSSLITHHSSPSDVFVTVGDREYRIRGLARNHAPGVMKVNVRVTRGEALHQDTLDLCEARRRKEFARDAAPEFGVAEEVIDRDLKRVLLSAEEVQDQLTADVFKPKVAEVVLTDAERILALDLLTAPDLPERILADFRTCGIVGEETNLLVGFLGAVSRLLDRPLGILIQSSSAAGKTSLMDAVLGMLPKDAKVKYSAMTGQSLFYMGDRDLRHKVLAIAEEEGARKAGFSLKLLQSDGELKIASTGKNAQTGRLSTHEYEVEGPVMLFSTTTAVDLDEELLNRCIILTVDEDREQTRAIHRRQRERYTVEGLWAETDAACVRTLHRHAQGLLRTVKVVNPYARDLTFLDDKTRTRRDNLKYLTLIAAIALLHQYQRPRRQTVRDGEVQEFIEAGLDDIALANRLADEVLGRSLDELPPQTRLFLFRLDEWVTAECLRLGIAREDFRFTQRTVREALGWGNTQVKLHLGRLLEFEYLLPHRGGRGQQFVYELLYDGKGKDGKPFLMGLIDVERLRATTGSGADRSEETGDMSGRGRAEVGPKSAASRSGIFQAPLGQNGDFGTSDQKIAHVETEKPNPDPDRGTRAAAGGAYGEA